MESLQKFMNEQAEACKARAAALTADNRQDEAVFEKIRGNVFEIFTAVLNAARKQSDPVDFFRRQLTAIPANWEAALEKAAAHGDEAKAHTERIKLDAVRAIREQVGDAQ
ncbi:MAG: hypothetical protein IJY40_05990 [Oscillospiraceae bacterium]|nr:hypothetical protein [Oscillospiraceae bacterium]